MKTSRSPSVSRKLSLLAACAISVIAASASAQQVPREPFLDFEGGPLLLPPDDGLSGSVPSSSAVFGTKTPRLQTSSAGVDLSFKGVSQFDLRNMLNGSSYIPPDTMGAVGATQFMETTNGVYAIYDKSTGALQSMLRADTFWANAGATGGMNGDARILFDKTSQRWITLQFGASVSDIQIAVSTTSDAMGPWKSTKFTGYAGGTADYPTLAIDKDAVYIGTNNFNSAGSFRGTTLNVISRNDLFGATPTAANVKQFVTPYSPTTGGADGGYAIQGVNSTGPVSGRVIAASLYQYDALRFDIANAGTAGATKGATTLLGLTPFTDNSAAAQPDGTHNIDAFDSRIGASAWEHDGKIYSVFSATDPAGGANAQVRFFVTDATTNAVLQEGVIADPNFDYYQGSLAVNDAGQVVIGYNRSGLSTADTNGDGLPDGNVSFMARAYNTDASGMLVQTNEYMLHVSEVSDYHNGSVQGAPATGRQRWGDYSAVTVDPNNSQAFWAIGEYADAWNNAAGGHPDGSGGSDWGTWVSQITLTAAVPEPGTYAMMLAGLVAIGGVARRRSGRA